MALPPSRAVVEDSALSSILDAPLFICSEYFRVPTLSYSIVLIEYPKSGNRFHAFASRNRGLRCRSACESFCKTPSRRQCSLPCDFRGVGQIGAALPNAAKKSAEIPFERGEAGSDARVPGPPDFLAPTSSASPAAAAAACACSPPRCPSRCYLSGGVSGSGCVSLLGSRFVASSLHTTLSLLSLRCAATAHESVRYSLRQCTCTASRRSRMAKPYEGEKPASSADTEGNIAYSVAVIDEHTSDEQLLEYNISPAEKKRLLRRLDSFIAPMVAILCEWRIFFAFCAA